MRFCLNTDCLGYMPFEEMLDTVAALGYESIEIACGNWSKAPHIDLDAMLASEETRKNYMDAIAKRGLVLEVLNCSGNQLAPNEEGKQHQEVVEKTFKLAGLLGIKKIVMMSGCPGGRSLRKSSTGSGKKFSSRTGKRLSSWRRPTASRRSRSRITAARWSTTRKPSFACATLSARWSA